MKKKVVFIGTGYMANEYAKVLKKEFRKQVELVGALNKSSSSIKKFVKKFKVKKNYTNLREMMNACKPDIVIVCVNELSTFKILKI